MPCGAEAAPSNDRIVNRGGTSDALAALALTTKRKMPRARRCLSDGRHARRPFTASDHCRFADERLREAVGVLAGARARLEYAQAVVGRGRQFVGIPPVEVFS